MLGPAHTVGGMQRRDGCLAASVCVLQVSAGDEGDEDDEMGRHCSTVAPGKAAQARRPWESVVGNTGRRWGSCRPKSCPTMRLLKENGGSGRATGITQPACACGTHALGVEACDTSAEYSECPVVLTLARAAQRGRRSSEYCRRGEGGPVESLASIAENAIRVSAWQRGRSVGRHPAGIRQASKQ